MDEREIADIRHSEEMVLAAALQAAAKDENLLPLIRQSIELKDFALAHTRRIFAAMIEAETKCGLPQWDIAWKLLDDSDREDITYLFTDAVAITASLDYHLQEIRQRAIARKVRTIGSRLQTYEGDIGTALSKTQDYLSKLSIGLVKKRDSKVGGFLDGVMSQINNRGGEDIPGLASGYAQLDKLTLGFEPGLIIIAARPSMGKSCFVFNVLQNMAVSQDIPVAIFSCETGRDRVLERILTRQAGLPFDMVRKGQFHLPADLQKLEQGRAELEGAPLYIFDAKDKIRTVDGIKTQVLNMPVKPALIAIDHIQKLHSPDTKKDRIRELEEISNGLADLAEDLQIPIILLAQLSRACDARKDKRPVLSDLKDCGAIEQDADIVAFVFREEYYEPKDENRGKTELILAKNRDGKTGTVPLLFKGDYQSFFSVNYEGKADLRKETYLGTSEKQVTVRDMRQRNYEVKDESGQVVFHVSNPDGVDRLTVWSREKCLEIVGQWLQKSPEEQTQMWCKLSAWIAEQPSDGHSMWAVRCLEEMIKAEAEINPLGVVYDDGNTVDLFADL